jgi:hypothetical protein
LLREYENRYNEHRPHRSLGQATPHKPLRALLTSTPSESGDVIWSAVSSANMRRWDDTDGVSGTHRP